MATNRAAFQPSKQASSLVVKDAPYPKAGSGQVIIRNHAVAINPIDWLIATRGDIVFSHIKYPFPLGYDVAGDVVEVGPGVTRLSAGDRVTGLARGANPDIHDASQGGFQRYVVLDQDLTTRLPASLPFEMACVLPLGVATAACALFDPSQLGLRLPEEPGHPCSKSEVVIIWGGSSSVGCNAIQLATAAGYEVFTTASPKNYERVKQLGASQVWDYSDPSAAADIVAAIGDRAVVGALAMGNGSIHQCMAIMSRCGKNSNKTVSMVTAPVSHDELHQIGLPRTIATFVYRTAGLKLRGAVSGVRTTMNELTQFYTNGVAKHVFTDFLEKAIASGSFRPAPDAEVIGHGLEDVQKAMEIQKKGVSAKKIVVSL